MRVNTSLLQRRQASKQSLALCLPVQGFLVCKVHMRIALEAAAGSVCVQPHFGDGAVTHEPSQLVLAGLKCYVPNICNIVTVHLHPNHNVV